MARLEFDGSVVEIDQLVIAGWTGRDVAALNHHIEELKAIGVQPPSARCRSIIASQPSC